MITTRHLAVALGIVLSSQLAYGQSAGHYREFQLGGDLASVSALSGVAAAEAKTIHEQPAVMQDLQWRLPYTFSGVTTPPQDPVEQIVFSFYNDQLFRLVIDYDRERTEGMTDADMIEGISSIYGPISKASQTTRVSRSQVAQESGALVARWGNADYTAVLYRSSSAPEFRLIVTDMRLGALAGTAEAQARLLDERDAPQREIARQKKEADDVRAAQEKARVANKAAFRP